MATLGLKEMENVAIAEFFWKMQRKTWYSILGMDAMSLSLKNLLLRMYFNPLGDEKMSFNVLSFFGS